MCDYCRRLVSNLLIRHTYMECPLRKSMYCPVCATKGHRPADCPNQSAWSLRTGGAASPTADRILRIQDNEEAIQKFLKERGIRPVKRKLENRKLLADFANSQLPPLLIEFTSP
jgi:hypothetical protein